MKYIRQVNQMDEQDDLAVRPAASRDELRSAYARVYWSYRRRAYVEADATEMELSIFNALPCTVTFVSAMRGRVTASITLIPDSALGLPMDETWNEELQELRGRGRHLAEATMFADRRHRDFRRVVPMLLLLMKRLFDYACMVEQADDLCISVTPRHRGFYEKFLSFTPLQEAVGGGRNERTIPLRLALDGVESKCKEREDLRKLFLENRTPRSVLEDRYCMNCEDLQYFFVDSTDVFDRAAPESLRKLRSHYPDCPWDRWMDSA